MISAALILSLLAGPVMKVHSWYDVECCAGNDCEPVAAETVRAGKGGYSVFLKPGEHKLVTEKSVTGFVTYPEARHSQDAKFHVCIVAGKVKCLYVPPGGV